MRGLARAALIILVVLLIAAAAYIIAENSGNNTFEEAGEKVDEAIEDINDGVK